MKKNLAHCAIGPFAAEGLASLSMAFNKLVALVSPAETYTGKHMDKKYLKRIRSDLAQFAKYRFLHEPLWDLSTDEEVGEAFVNLVASLDRKHMGPVRRAFAESGLNPDKLFCWGELLRLFATVHYTRGKHGRRPICSPAYDVQFAADLYEISCKTRKTKKAELARQFLKHTVSRRDIYRTLKKVTGVTSAINALEKRQKRDWLEFAQETLSRSGTEDDGDSGA